MKTKTCFLGFCLFFVSFAAASFAGEEKTLTLKLLAKIQSVRQVAISPDASSIAYTLSVPRKPWKDKDGGAWSELYLVETETGKARGFITGEVEVNAIDWLPNGSGISFLSKRGEDKYVSLYVIPKDGGEARRAISLGSDILAYSWKHDGSKLALIATEAENESVKKRKEKGFNQEIYEEDWKARKIWVATPFSDTEKRTPLSVTGSAFEIEWSPVDDRLAVSLAPTPLVDDEYMSKRVHVIDALSGTVLAKVENPGKLGAVHWSPDAKLLAMLSASDLHDTTPNRLMVVSADGGTPKSLMPKLEGDVEHFAWQNNDSILFVGTKGAFSTFCKIQKDGSALKEILPKAEQALTAFSLSNDGYHGAFVASSANHPPELYTMKHGDNGPRRLTESNLWLKELPLANQEVIRYKARDGVEIEGILIHPLGEKPGTKYPLILVVHGGPESHYKNDWLTNYSSGGQVAAAKGFAVFFPNYRGSTGRGIEFAKMSQGDPAGKEFDDLIDGVDALIERGLIDKSKVGVTGGSYGGYATAWCSTRYSDRFAAGVMFVGISDKISKLGTTDIPNEEFSVHALKHPWDDWSFFLSRSPIYYADRCKTPLLILHGKDDPRVNPGQSRELYRNVKLRTDTPVRLVFYPGEGHGNRRAASRYDFSLRMMQWMEHYLKGPGGAAPAYELTEEVEEKVEPAALGTGSK